ncbi:MAG: VanW family protein [Patescibacteria group bacterium]|jgi:vancomycin resistance protein YoaR
MPKFELSSRNGLIKQALYLAVIFFIALILLFLILGAAVFAFQKIYQGKIFPGVYLGAEKLSGLTADETSEILNKKISELENKGVDFYLGREKETVFPVMAGTGADFAVPLINFDEDRTLKNIFSYGRGNGFFSGFKDIISAAIYGERIFLAADVNEEKINELLKTRFAGLEIPPKSAGLAYENGAFSLTKEATGKTIDYEKALNIFKNNLRRLNFSSVELEINEDDRPEIKLFAAEQSNVINQAEKILSLAPLTIAYEKKEWKIEKDELAAWLNLKKEFSYCLSRPGECPENRPEIKTGLSEEKVREYFEKNILPEIEIPAQTAKFKMENGKVTIFQAGRDGLSVNMAETLARIEYGLAVKENNRSELAVEAVKSEIEEGDVNDLGIKEIIGTGKSNFAGSPKNRRHNIKTGASYVNGTLIKPGEEFSLLKTLGAIDKSTGYLTELVIKGNKTIPEYGGGLCQIGTTVFRGATASGLPITARTNHSYRVSYYEPAGTDATIYDPAPDFKFLNDTGHHVLIQSRIEGDLIYFDYWGTADGRAATSTYPTIYNIVKPGPTKIIETTDLKPGEKKCTESAHNGADAYFDYKVTYPSGEIKEKRFSSHYRPWQAVCLLGVEKAAETTNPAEGENKTGETDPAAPSGETPKNPEIPADPSNPAANLPADTPTTGADTPVGSL